MPKYDLIANEIEWCETHRNPEQEVYQDGFIAGLQHALFLMKSSPTLHAPDKGYAPAKNSFISTGSNPVSSDGTTPTPCG